MLRERISSIFYLHGLSETGFRSSSYYHRSWVDAGKPPNEYIYDDHRNRGFRYAAFLSVVPYPFRESTTWGGGRVASHLV